MPLGSALGLGSCRLGKKYRVGHQRATGTVKWFGSTRSCGLISRDSGQGIFVYDLAIQDPGLRSLGEGQRVGFSTEQAPKRLQVTSVILL